MHCVFFMHAVIFDQSALSRCHTETIPSNIVQETAPDSSSVRFASGWAVDRGTPPRID